MRAYAIMRLSSVESQVWFVRYLAFAHLSFIMYLESTAIVPRKLVPLSFFPVNVNSPGLGPDWVVHSLVSLNKKFIRDNDN